MKHAFRYPIILISALLLPLTSNADSIGRVIYAAGEVKAELDGKVRTLKRGSFIRKGENLITGKSSRTQLRMSDNALIAIRPNSKMSFDEYRYEKTDRKGDSLMSLVKGGFRTITGLIGRYNKDRYRVRTSVATIGVRGTHYGLTLCQGGDCLGNKGGNIDDGLYGSVVDGAIVADNDSGEFIFANDEYFHVPNKNAQPRALIRPPGVIFDQAKMEKRKHEQKKQVAKKVIRMKQDAVRQNVIEQKQEYVKSKVINPDFIAGDDSNNNINLIDAPQGSEITMAFYSGTIAGGDLSSVNARVIDNDGTDNIILNTLSGDNTGAFFPVLVDESSQNRKVQIGQAEVRDLGVQNIGAKIGWGRWTQPYLLDDSGPKTHSGHLHYAFTDKPTSPGQLASLNVNTTYGSVGGTRATDLAGNTANNFAAIQLQADFGFEQFDYDIITIVGGDKYSASGSVSGTGAKSMLTSTGFTFGVGGANNIDGMATTATGDATITFVGDSAQGALTTYNLTHNSTPNGKISGAAFMVQGAAVVTPN